MAEDSEPATWYAVRTIFAGDSAEPGVRAYEERITLWRAHSFDDALGRAETEARDYAEALDFSHLGLAQAYKLFGPPGDGAEIFSLIRGSTLAADQYLEAFFDTGAEYQTEQLTEPALTALPPPAPAALLWNRPVLGVMTSQGDWEPEVQLVNQSETSVVLNGPLRATGILLRPNGLPVTSAQAQESSPADSVVHRLGPGETVAIRILVSLTADDLAALDPGLYQLANVSWGDLSAAPKDVRVDR